MTSRDPETRTPAHPADRTVPGRVIVTEKALRRTFSALAAEELGVAAGDVTTRVADAAGRLRVTVEAPIALPPLGTGPADTPSALTTADAARTRIHRDGARLSGAALADVRVRLSGATITERRRVS